MTLVAEILKRNMERKLGVEGARAWVIERCAQIEADRRPAV